MALTFAGELTLASVVPGFAALIATYEQVLVTLSATVGVQIDLLGGLRGSIEAAVLIEVQAQLDGVLNLVASLQAAIADPAAYLATLVRGAAQVTANLQVLLPPTALGVQLSASLEVSAQLLAKKAAIELVLALIGQVQDALSLAVSVSVDATINFAQPGILFYRYTGQLGSLGSELGAAISIGQTGSLTSATPVNGYVLVAAQGNAGASGALSAVFG
jgi:hypothetical protein